MASLTSLHKARGRVKTALTRIEKALQTRTDLSYARAKAYLDEIDIQSIEWKKIMTQIEEEALSMSHEQQEKEEKEAEDLCFRFSDLRCEVRVIMTELHVETPPGTTPQANSSLEDVMCRVYTQQERMLEQINETSRMSSTALQSNTSRVKLPELQLPSFSGKYTDWQSFKDMLEAMIHTRANLPDVEKLNYLKISLKGGEAESLLKNISSTGDNYRTAWEKLNERFDKKSLIAAAHIERFLKHPPVRESKVSLIKQAYDVYKESVDALEMMGDEYSSKDIWLVHMMQKSMDYETRKLWSQEDKSGQAPSIDKWFEFLRWRMDSLEVCGETNESQASKDYKGLKRDKSDTILKTHHTEATKCSMCTQAHYLFQCETFKKLSTGDKRSFTSEKNLCFNCLRDGHRAQVCRNPSRCQKCHKRHHTLLHEETQSANTSTKEPGVKSSEDTDSEAETSKTDTSKDPEATVHHAVSSKKILLPTALVKVTDVNGGQQICRVLIDQGSEITLISEACAQRLNLQRRHARLAIKGTGQSSVGYTKGAMKLHVMSQYDDKNNISVEAFVLDKLTSNLPGQPISVQGMKHIKGLQLADPEFNKPAKIDIILGMEYAWEINLPEKKSAPGCPIAQLTVFGWVLGGVVSEGVQEDTIQVLHSYCDIGASLQRFWEAEELPDKKILTKEEQKCEEDFLATHKRDATGRFTVKLCLKEDRETLGHSRQAAQARLAAMERKFRKHPDFHKQYTDFMEEYRSLGHMEEVPTDEIDKDETYIIPHQAVVRPTSTTTKLRVVFDASCKSSSGVSLNDILAVGPQVQDDLLAILMRFRTYKIAFQADVEKMYRQVLISEEDRDFLRVLWRTTLQEPVKIYRLKTVTYGTASAPYLATRTLQQMAIDAEEAYPDASEGIRNGFYMDDLLHGAETIEDSVRISDEIKGVLMEGGFPLRKWASNAPEVLSTKEPNEITSQEDNNGVSTLGVKWYPETDEMQTEIHTPQEAETRRGFLSEAAKVYDPMGAIAPVTVKFKILFQKVWATTKNWDDALSDEDKRDFDAIRQEFEILRLIRIPRCVPHNGRHLELHAFADASQKAFGTVIYARRCIQGEYQVCFLIAKSRVSPLKPKSIPRLELKAALLLSEVIKKIKDSYPHLEVSVTAWSDSTTVLQWLQSHPAKWQTFVAQRTARILEVLSPQVWRYVPTKENPADCLSRGIMPSELVNHPLWLTGPMWLTKDCSAWPENKVIIPVNTGEEKITKMLTHATVKKHFSLFEYVKDVSSYNKMVISVAYFVRISTRKDQRETGPLKVWERRKALMHLIRDVQKEEFSDEIDQCTRGEPISRRSKLVKLMPFLDENQIMRVRGRLRYADLTYDARHPMILPGNHRFTELLIQHYHKLHLHAGFDQMIGLLRHEYWIVGARNATRRVLNKCVTCFHHRPTLQSPVMADLPASRVTQIRPFVNVGCDYAGPFEIKSSNLRTTRYVKGYICLFICMATKAIHLEAVGDQSSEGFINALKRFISRRGYCQNIYCDNGRNFVGACSHKNDEQRLQGKVCKIMAEANVEFHFNPPYAPTFGGLWERAIGSTKFHLKRVMGDQKLTFEAFSTILCEIEACLNSRPLCALSVEPENQEVLTPGHFLIGQPLKLLPSEDKTEIPINRLQRYEQMQRAVQSFWKRWKDEYLTSLQQRPKWAKDKPSLQPGDLVLIKEDNVKPGEWARGRVVECHPGKDDVTRVVSLKTAGGIVRRAVSRLAKLPVQ